MSNNNEVIWEIRAEKVLHALKEGKRIDGRKMGEYRSVKIQKNISHNADGSARVKLGETDVIAGIKLSPGEPFPDLPDKGTISVGVELLPLASPDFESGPPRSNSIELARVVDRGIRESGAIDFTKLCIREGELCWIAFIDLYALNFDGNLFDAFSIAALAALLETRIPKLEEDKIVKEEYAGKLKLANKPLLSTFVKIKNSVLLDPNLFEEKALDARISLATIEDNSLCAFQKGGSGSFELKEIEQAIDIALKKSKEIRKLL